MSVHERVSHEKWPIFLTDFIKLQNHSYFYLNDFDHYISGSNTVLNGVAGCVSSENSLTL